MVPSVLIEPNEIAVFRRYRLDATKVAFLRARLQCIPPYPLKELRRRSSKLAAFFRKIEALEREANAISHELAAIGVRGAYSESIDMMAGTASFEWDLAEEKWGGGDTFEDLRRARIIEDYRDRPKTAIFDCLERLFDCLPLDPGTVGPVLGTGLLGRVS